MSRAAWTILRVWIGLCVLLALTTSVAFLQLGSVNLAIALSIATAKAVLVLWFFMELRSSAGLTRAFAVAGFFWLLILIALTWTDFAYRKDTLAPVEISSPRSP
jgi:cytochrome c oxidase subunit 4